jgi:hypothetical protein
VAGSQVRYNADWGAMLVEANSSQIAFKFYSRASLLVDTYTLNTSITPTPTATFTFTNTPTSTALPTQTNTPLPSHTPTHTTTPLPSDTPTATFTPTDTPLPSDTPTPTVPPTHTNTPLPTDTPTSTQTSTNTPLPSNTPTPSATSTATYTPTNTPTRTPTATSTSTPVPSNTPTPTATLPVNYLFTDGFESGNFSAWTSVNLSGDGSAIVQSSTVKTGSFAARLSETSNTSSKAYVRKNLATPENNITVSGWFMITQEGASNANVPIFRLYDSTGKRLLTLYRQNLSSNRVYVTDGGTRLLASRTMPLNTWVKFDLHIIVAGNGASTIEVYMDGVLAAQTTTANLGTAGVSTLQIGNDTARQAFTMFADEITARK